MSHNIAGRRGPQQRSDRVDGYHRFGLQSAPRPRRFNRFISLGNMIRIIFSLALITLWLAAPVSAQTSASRRSKHQTNRPHAGIERLANEGHEAEALSRVNALLAVTPDNVSLLLLKGSLSDKLQNYEAASVCYAQALKLAPNNPEVFYGTGLHLLLIGEIPPAIEMLRSALRLRPAHVENLYYLSQALHLNQQTSEALAVIEQAEKLAPGNAAVLQKRGELLAATKLYKQALPFLLKAERLDAELPDLNLQIGILYRDGEQDFSKAEFYLERARLSAPQDPRTLFELGELAARRQSWPEAKELYLTAASRGLKSAALYFGLGSAKLALKDYRAAVDDINQALKLDPTLAQTHYKLGQGYRKLGDGEQASYHEKIFADTQNRLATPSPFGSKGDGERRLWEEAAAILKKDGEPQALAFFKTLIAKDPNRSEEKPAFLLGTLYLSLRDTVRAEAMFRQALAINAQAANVHAYLGFAHLEQNELKEAETEFREELRADQHHSLALAGLGKLYYKQGRWSDSIDYLKESRTSSPSMIYLLCDAYLRLDQRNEALLQAEVLRTLAGNDPAVMNPLNDLLERYHLTVRR